MQKFYAPINPISAAVAELSSQKLKVPELTPLKMRGAGTPFRRVPPYFDPCLPHSGIVSKRVTTKRNRNLSLLLLKYCTYLLSEVNCSFDCSDATVLVNSTMRRHLSTCHTYSVIKHTQTLDTLAAGRRI